jgi:protein-arginine kinase activator protein McsA
MADAVEVECPHCDYAWHSKVKKQWVCCPNCMKKFHNPNVSILDRQLVTI